MADVCVCQENPGWREAAVESVQLRPQIGRSVEQEVLACSRVSQAQTRHTFYRLPAFAAILTRCLSAAELWDSCILGAAQHVQLPGARRLRARP